MNEEDIKAEFNRYDVDGNGFISKEEMQKCVDELFKGEGQAKREEICQDLVNACDDSGAGDKDGKISYEEFKKGIMGK